MLTYKDLTDRVLRWIDEATDTQTTLLIVQDAINASHRRLLAARQWPFMAWPRTQSFTTVAGQSIYPLNPNANRVYHLWDTEIDQYLSIVPRREWPAVGANRSNTSTAPYGAILGPNWPVAAQPTTPSVITVVSNSAADTGGPTVVIRGIDSNGDEVEEELTLTGTTAVTGAVTFVEIIAITKTGTWAGTLTVTDAVPTTLLTLIASEYGKIYPTVEFLEPPLAGRVFTYNFQRKPRLLTRDNDIPDTPYPYSEIHVYDTLLDLTTYNTELGGKEQVLWKKRYDELFDGMVVAWDEEIVGAYPRMVRDLDDSNAGSRVGVFNP